MTQATCGCLTARAEPIILANSYHQRRHPRRCALEAVSAEGRLRDRVLLGVAGAVTWLTGDVNALTTHLR